MRVVVLAHPTKYKMTRTKLCLLMRFYRWAVKLEVISGAQVPLSLGQWLCVASITCWHPVALISRSEQPWASLGTYRSCPQTANRCGLIGSERQGISPFNSPQSHCCVYCALMSAIERLKLRDKIQTPSYNISVVILNKFR